MIENRTLDGLRTEIFEPGDIVKSDHLAGYWRILEFIGSEFSVETNDTTHMYEAVQVTKYDDIFVDEKGLSANVKLSDNARNRLTLFKNVRDKDSNSEVPITNNDILEITSKLMLSDNYKDRFKAEYYQTKIRYDKLHAMVIKYAAGTLDFKPICSLELLEEQASAMGKYLKVLEIRAEKEKIKLGLWTTNLK